LRRGTLGYPREKAIFLFLALFPDSKCGTGGSAGFLLPAGGFGCFMIFFVVFPIKKNKKHTCKDTSIPDGSLKKYSLLLHGMIHVWRYDILRRMYFLI